jgi:4-amino-4-deoxy-L-arabinose transferase-like glycosyltransferase
MYYVVTRLFWQLPLPAEVSYRLPSTLGFLVFSICLFLLVRPIAGATAGLISALLPLTTPLYDPYAIEARPYASVCAFLALALLFWQQSNRSKFALLFACSIAAAMSLHYYTVFLLGAFIAGEVIVSLWQHSFHWQVMAWDFSLDYCHSL